MADEPLLGGPPTGEAADPLAVLYRETASLTEGAVRYAMLFPDGVDEQARLCEGLEGMIAAARRRFDQLAGTLERDASGAPLPANGVSAYRVTAVGYGISSNTQVMLQSIVVKQKLDTDCPSS